MKRKNQIYLDHNATTRLDPAVREEMLLNMDDVFGNPSSVHAFGREARSVLDRSREKVAKLIGAAPDEVIFTSGGTESNNQAVCGIAEIFGDRKRHIITTATEHQALLQPCRYLEKRGFEIIYLAVDENGRLDPEDLSGALREDTALVSVMLANNDVGTIQPLEEVSRIAKAKGVLVHTDAVQAVGKIPVDVDSLGVDLLSFSGHKLYGPKGIGALFVRRGIPVEPILRGGHQERLLRAGTENVPAIAGFGKACEIAAMRLGHYDHLIRSLRDRFENSVLEQIPCVRVNGHSTLRLPNTSNMSFASIDGEILVVNLDVVGVAASTGAACNSADHQPSHVLLAMGRSAQEALTSVRFSFGLENGPQDVDQAVELLREIVGSLRRDKVDKISHNNSDRTQMKPRPSGERVVVAMSGGVDSSVAAALLNRDGFQVIGVTLQLHTCQENLGTACCGIDGIVRAREVARSLGIPHYVLNWHKQFEDLVLRPTWDEFSLGRTPNPCLLCNERIKFGLLQDRARELGAKWVATGHYGRIADSSAGTPLLFRARDKHKDQSYFLARLNRTQLRKILFPIGHLEKKHVRELARQFGFVNADAPESQDACLVAPGQGFSEMLRRRFGEKAIEGPIIDDDGSMLKFHKGIHRFTVGQRKGLGIAAESRIWVKAIDGESGSVFVTRHSDELLSSGLVASDVQWIGERPTKWPLVCEIQVRYRQKPVRASLEPVRDDSVRAVFGSAIRAVTPGQAAVFFDEDRVLAGGWIAASEPVKFDKKNLTSI